MKQLVCSEVLNLPTAICETDQREWRMKISASDHRWIDVISTGLYRLHGQITDTQWASYSSWHADHISLTTQIFHSSSTVGRLARGWGLFLFIFTPFLSYGCIVWRTVIASMGPWEFLLMSNPRSLSQHRWMRLLVTRAVNRKLKIKTKENPFMRGDSILQNMICFTELDSFSKVGFSRSLTNSQRKWRPADDDPCKQCKLRWLPLTPNIEGGIRKIRLYCPS